MVMDRILLGAEILPWKDPVSGEINEASRILPLALPAVPSYLLIEELAEIIVRKFERLHPDKGKLEIKCLFNGYKQMLDMADSVGDIFVDRTAGGVDERGFTVLVQRELPSPAELSGSIRFASVPPDSFARPPKRPSHGLLRRATAGRYAQENAQERTEQMNKRRRLNKDPRESLLNPDCAVRSTERDLELPVIDEAGVEVSRRDASTCIIEDSQRSPLRSQLNTYATLTFLSILPQNSRTFKRNGLVIPNSPNSRAGSPVRYVHEAARNTREETPKSESPETDNIVNDIPLSNPNTPSTPAPPQSEAQQKISAKPSLPFPKTKTPNKYKQNNVLGATGLTTPRDTTPRDTTPGGQSAASITESRPGQPSYGRVSTDRSLSSKAFVSGRRNMDIYAIESEIESSQDVPLGRPSKRSKQHQSPAAQSLSGSKLFSRFNGSSASMPISNRLSRDFSDGQRRSTSGQATSHEKGSDQADSKSPNLASITAPIFEKSMLQRHVDHAQNKIGRELPLFPDSHISSVERSDGEPKLKNYRKDSADVDNDQKRHAKRPGKDKPSAPNKGLQAERNLCSGTPSISASRAVQGKSHVQSVHEESSDATDVDTASDNEKDTSTDAQPIDSQANTSIPPIFRTKAAKKSAPAESSESERSETHDSESDELSDQEQVPDSKGRKNAGRTASMQEVDSESKTAEEKSLPAKQKPDAPTTSTARSSKAVKGGPGGAASKAPPNKLSVNKQRTSITSPIPTQGSALINRYDTRSLRGTPSRNVNSNALKGPSTTCPSSLSLQRSSHRSVSFEDEVKNVSENPSVPLVPLVEKENNPTKIKLVAKTWREELEAKNRSRQKFLEEARAECAGLKLARKTQGKPEYNKGKLTEAASEPLVSPLPTIIKERSKDKGTATTSEKETVSATNAARSLGSPPKSKAASLEVAVVPTFPKSFTTDKYPKRAKLPQDDKDKGLVEENKDISYAFKRPESKSESRSPARVVSSSISSSSASQSGSESDTDSNSRGDSVDTEGNGKPLSPVKLDMASEPHISAIEVASDRGSSDSETETDDGKLAIAAPISLSKSVPTSPPLPSERTNSETASARDSVERQVQREIRESMEPSRSSQMGPPPKTSAKPETFSPFVKSGPATLEKRGVFSVNARLPTFSSQMNNPKYKNPVINSSRQPKPAATVSGNKYIENEVANDTDSSESDDEDDDDEESADDEDIGTKAANPRSSQKSEGKSVARNLRKLLRMSKAVHS